MLLMADVGAGWDVNSNNGEAGKFPGEVKRSASHYHELYIQTAMAGDQSSVATPVVISVYADFTSPRLF